MSYEWMDEGRNEKGWMFDLLCRYTIHRWNGDNNDMGEGGFLVLSLSLSLSFSLSVSHTFFLSIYLSVCLFLSLSKSLFVLGFHWVAQRERHGGLVSWRRRFDPVGMLCGRSRVSRRRSRVRWGIVSHARSPLALAQTPRSHSCPSNKQTKATDPLESRHQLMNQHFQKSMFLFWVFFVLEWIPRSKRVCSKLRARWSAKLWQTCHWSCSRNWTTWSTDQTAHGSAGSQQSYGSRAVRRLDRHR